MKIYHSKADACYFSPRCIMVMGKYGKDGILYAEGRQMGKHCFFDDRRFVMTREEFEKNFEQQKEG